MSRAKIKLLKRKIQKLRQQVDFATGNLGFEIKWRDGEVWGSPEDKTSGPGSPLVKKDMFSDIAKIENEADEILSELEERGFNRTEILEVVSEGSK